VLFGWSNSIFVYVTPGSKDVINWEYRTVHPDSNQRNPGDFIKNTYLVYRLKVPENIFKSPQFLRRAI
jgi:hypothetical protein